MASASPRPIFVPQPVEVARPQTRVVVDPLDSDRIDYDAWLLPPVEIDATERFVRFVSRAAGPVALLALSLFAAPIIF